MLAPTLRSAAAGTVTVDVGHRRSAQFVDMLGLGGGPGEFALSPRQLLLDGRPIAPTMFRLYPIPNGGRVFLLRPMTFQRMVFTPGSMVKVIDGADPSVVGSVSPTFGCSIFNCTPTPIQILPWKDGVIDFDIRLDHPGVRMDDWAGPEPWGRWTTAKRGRLEFYIDPPSRPVTISTRFGPILGTKRTKARAWLWVNDCKLAERKLYSFDKIEVDAPIPQKCLRDDGRLRIEWRSDKVVRPVDLKINGDTRRLGIAVESVILRQTP